MRAREGRLHFDDYAGRYSVPVRVVGETRTRYRIAPADDKPLKLAGRNRWLQPGATALVPRQAVSFAALAAPGLARGEPS